MQEILHHLGWDTTTILNWLAGFSSMTSIAKIASFLRPSMIWKPFFGQAGSQAPATRHWKIDPIQLPLKGFWGCNFRSDLPCENWEIRWFGRHTPRVGDTRGCWFRNPNQPPFGCIKPTVVSSKAIILPGSQGVFFSIEISQILPSKTNR